MEESKEVRGTGRSTRLIDIYIQELFTNKEIIVIDHYDDLNSHRILAERICKRLTLEHPNVRKVRKFENGKYKISIKK